MGTLKEELRSYSRTVLDHFEHPRNVGSLDRPTLVVTAENPSCQDVVRMSVKLDKGTISDVRVKILGCTVAIASASLLTELMRGRTLKELSGFSQEDLVRALGGLPEQKVRCTGAPLLALQKILSQAS